MLGNAVILLSRRVICAPMLPISFSSWTTDRFTGLAKVASREREKKTRESWTIVCRIASVGYYCSRAETAFYISQSKIRSGPGPDAGGTRICQRRFSMRTVFTRYCHRHRMIDVYRCPALLPQENNRLLEVPFFSQPRSLEHLVPIHPIRFVSLP